MKKKTTNFFCIVTSFFVTDFCVNLKRKVLFLNHGIKTMLILSLLFSVAALRGQTVFNATDLQNAINAATNGVNTTITIGGNFAIPSVISIPDNKIITLTGTGVTLTVNGDWRHITVGLPGTASNGTLTFAAGSSITLSRLAGYTGNGGGVSVLNGATFTMNGSRITNNHSNNANASYGGGVELVGSTFTMTGGEIDNNTATYGGGVNADRSTVTNAVSTFTMSGGIIRNNNCIQSGGGISNLRGSILNLSGGTISHNDGYSLGGGVSNGSHIGPVVGGAVTLSNSVVITNNTAGQGGGVCNYAGSLTMLGGTISDNSATYGGGVVNSNSFGTVSLSNLFDMSGGTITRNEAIQGGGVFNRQNGTFKLSNGEISYNNVYAITTTGETIGGGGVMNRGSFDMTGGLITRNESTVRGGGVDIGGEGGIFPGTFTMSAGTISFNKANTGGGVYLDARNLSSSVLTSFTMSGTALITGNDANLSGGGVCGFGEFIMQAGTISDNTASQGGGVHFQRYSSALAIPTLRIEGGIITGNEAIDRNNGYLHAGMGGGLTYSFVNATITGSAQITGNKAKYGGGVCASNQLNAGYTNVNGDVKITLNTATEAGGGLYCSDTSLGQLQGFRISGNAEISNNSAPIGGGVANYGYFSMYQNSKVINNTATVRGGGITNGVETFLTNNAVVSGNEAPSGGGVFSQTYFRMQGGSVTNNKAIYGGGVCLDEGGGSRALLWGGNISDNTADYGGGIYQSNYPLPSATSAFIVMRDYPTLPLPEITNNIARIAGGGIYNAFAPTGHYALQLEGGRISGNHAISGAGIYSVGHETNKVVNVIGGAAMEIMNNGSVTTVPGNPAKPATIEGGAIFMENLNSLTVGADVVFSGNQAASAVWLEDLQNSVVYDPGSPITVSDTKVLHGTNINTLVYSNAPGGNTRPFTYLANNYDLNFVGRNIYEIWNWADFAYINVLIDNEKGGILGAGDKLSDYAKFILMQDLVPVGGHGPGSNGLGCPYPQYERTLGSYGYENWNGTIYLTDGSSLKVGVSETALGRNAWHTTRGWIPIGSYQALPTTLIKQFIGEFDGNNKKINGLWIDIPTANAYGTGLFGAVQDSYIHHLSVVIANGKAVKTGQDSQFTGGLIAWMDNTTVTHCHATGHVETGDGGLYTGLLIGYAIEEVEVGGFPKLTYDNRIENCSASGNITVGGNGCMDVGGLTGLTVHAKVTDCHAVVTIVAGDWAFAIGGLIGAFESLSEATNCYATGNVTIEGNCEDVMAGGLFGFGLTSKATNCFATGNVTIGNIVNTSISHYERVGGFVGEIQKSGAYTNCYAMGNVVVGNNIVGGVGGFAGTADGNVVLTNCYATGSVTTGNSSVNGGTNYTAAGGLIGLFPCFVNNGNFPFNATITNCYSAGVVTADPISTKAGGFAGWLDNAVNCSVTFNNCHYDQTYNPTLSGVKYNTGGGTVTGLPIGKTTDYMTGANKKGTVVDGTAFASLLGNTNFVYRVPDLPDFRYYPQLKVFETPVTFVVNEQNTVKYWSLESVKTPLEPETAYQIWNWADLAYINVLIENENNPSYSGAANKKLSYYSKFVLMQDLGVPESSPVNYGDGTGNGGCPYDYPRNQGWYGYHNYNGTGGAFNSASFYTTNTLLVGGTGNTTGTAFASITGTANLPWQTGKGWKPVGPGTFDWGKFDYINPFTGEFDGQGYAVSGLWIKYLLQSEMDIADPQGLFGKTDQAIIKNLGVNAPDTIIGALYNGVLVGMAFNTNIYNCYVTGNIKAVEWSGGLVGTAWNNSVIAHCYSTVSLTSYAFGPFASQANSFGSLLGRAMYEVTVSNCYATGDVSLSIGGQVGGLIGHVINSSVSNCYATGKVAGEGWLNGGVGGLVGDLSTEVIHGGSPFSIATITNCFALNSTVINTGNTAYHGRVIGKTNGTVSFSNLYALDNMKINNAYVSGGTAGNKNGKDLAACDLIDPVQNLFKASSTGNWGVGFDNNWTYDYEFGNVTKSYKVTDKTNLPILTAFNEADFSNAIQPPSVEGCRSEVEVDITLFLQGVTQAGPIMTTYLQGPPRYPGLVPDKALPKKAPFTNMPEFYSQINEDSGTAGKVVDWVLVEIMTNFESFTLDGIQYTYYDLLESRALLLKPDGSVVDTNGNKPLFQPYSTRKVRIAIKTRNHLSVISSELLDFDSDVRYDFSENVTKALKLSWASYSAMIEKNGVACLYGGDVWNGLPTDRTINIINAVDIDRYNTKILSAWNLGDYMFEDVNMDAMIDSGDGTYIITNGRQIIQSPLLYYIKR